MSNVPQNGAGPSWAGRGLYDAFGSWTPFEGDPAFQPPSDPLADMGRTRARARRIDREIPNVIVETGWSPQTIRTALMDLVAGLFDRPAQLHDTMVADSRVQSAMKSRSGGLLGRPIRFKIPKRFKDDERAKKCLKAWEKHWPAMHAEPALLHLLETSHSLGFSYSQILWDTNGKVWLPYLQAFNARYGWYHWILRAHIAMTLDGATPITPGDGHWVLHAPYGQYRGWMYGALRTIAPWFLARQYTLRDWARYCERHGFPIPLAETPFGADPLDILAWQDELQGLGQESVMQLPGSVDVNKYGRYNLRYLEAQDSNWQAFKELILQCNEEITLALLAQNLTTQVKEGSFAAARVHADVRQALVEADARALAKTIYVQILRPFAALNYGDADLAPECEWDVRPPEDLKTKAETWESFCVALAQLKQAGMRIVDVERFARRFGIIGAVVEDTIPVPVEAKLAQSDSKVVVDDETKKSEEDDKQEQSKAEIRRIMRRRDARMSTRLRAIGRAQRASMSRLDAITTTLRDLSERVESPTQLEIPFAQRHAAFLADIKEMQDVGLQANIPELAKLHDVPIPVGKE